MHNEKTRKIDVAKFLGSKYLATIDVSGPQVVTIVDSFIEQFDSGEQVIALRFEELQKPFTLNKTNLAALVEIFQSYDAAEWLGPIGLYVDPTVTNSRQQRVGGVRVEAQVMSITQAESVMTIQPISEEAIFNIARKIESTEDRDEYLNQVCGDDQAVYARVLTLLRLHDDERSFTNRPRQVLSRPFHQSPSSKNQEVRSGPTKYVSRLVREDSALFSWLNRNGPCRARWRSKSSNRAWQPKTLSLGLKPSGRLWH